MTTGARLTAAGVCFVAGALAAWTVERHVAGPRRAGPNRSVVLPAGADPDFTASPSVLWVIAVGVSRYRDPALGLRYADRDAAAIAVAFERLRGGGLYRDVRTRVLTNEDVTRRSVLQGLEDLLPQVHADDVVVLFLAGHGVRDTATGSYYFLPSPADVDSMRTEGLRMTDIDELLRLLRSGVHSVVVILDTCHAGAMRTRAAGTAMESELMDPLSGGDGFFLLAAARAGEESQERDDLKHGVFTFALLEALAGAADGNRDGVLPVSELFGYVTRRVPALSEGAQHPYQKTEGTDLILATVPAGAPTASGTEPGAVVRAHRPENVADTIGVTEFRNLRGTPEDDWIGAAIRVAFNTELSKVSSLRVYVPQVVDRTIRARRTDYLAAAHRLGIRRLVTGSYQVVGTSLRIDAEVVDTAAGVEQASESVEGNLSDFFVLQKRLIESMLRRLRVAAPSEGGGHVHKGSSTDLDAYRLLLESEGVVGSPPSAAATPTPYPEPQSGLLPLFWWPWTFFSSPAYAGEPPAEIGRAVRQTLEELRLALEHKDVDKLASLYVSFTNEHRHVVKAYWRNADDLAVEIADITLDLRPAGVLATYTRIDRFVDHDTGRRVRLEARLARLVVLERKTWKLGAAQ